MLKRLALLGCLGLSPLMGQTSSFPVPETTVTVTGGISYTQMIGAQKYQPEFLLPDGGGSGGTKPSGSGTPATKCSPLPLRCSYPEPGNPGFTTKIYGPADEAGNCFQYEYDVNADSCELINNRVNCVAACLGH